MYRHPWIFIPYLVLLAFTMIVYTYFAVYKEWMLSHKSVQERGMMINANLMGTRAHVKDLAAIENLEKIPNPKAKTIRPAEVEKKVKSKNV